MWVESFHPAHRRRQHPERRKHKLLDILYFPMKLATFFCIFKSNTNAIEVKWFYIINGNYYRVIKMLIMKREMGV